MAYSEQLADRIRLQLNDKKTVFTERKMMGGLCFMVDEKMCVGVIEDKLMARIDHDIYKASLKRKGCRPMDFTGRPMKGYVFVEPIGVDMEKDLDYWLSLALEFNPKAKSSKKK